ncbi:gluconolaconase [Hymenobacter aquaticus]|uniref:Gluconolaconase n=1 Tax=Hymenobacter aquaticus TaxID=1867101 RepID=A0A4Z0Q3L8_9BACT|nr:gluconolaconase [Hymenobacter aquaticus]TGE23733.1 gluconolaconase [Hymenobacter aquaticus]
MDTSLPEPNKPVPPPTPDLITYRQPSLYPESVEFDTNSKLFYLSSLTTGTIGRIGVGSLTTYKPFITHTSLVSSCGLQIDAVGNRLLVTISDPGYNKAKTSAATKDKLAALASFDALGKQISYVDLGSLRPLLQHFANDVAVDAAGNCYVTDSFAPVIYKVDNKGKATVFLEDARLGAPAEKFGLNGIVFHPDGYLLVAKTDDGSLLKVPLTNPVGFTTVVTGQDLTGVDGLTLMDATTLCGVSGSQAKVFRLTSNNGWTTATLSGTFAGLSQYPTALARTTTTETYVLYSRLNELLQPVPSSSPDFSLSKLKF